jgi:hypothetical protein
MRASMKKAFTKGFSRKNKGKEAEAESQPKVIPEEASDAISLDPHSGTSVTAPSAQLRRDPRREGEIENICLPQSKTKIQAFRLRKARAILF